MKLARQPLHPSAAAPCLGADNAEVLKGLLGVSDAEYARLEQDEVIGTAYLETAD